MDEVIRQLAILLATQSLLAIGGLGVVLPDLYRVVVSEAHWVTETEFVALFALGQAAPGPNMLFVTILGWRLGGLTGALVATASFTLPALLIAALAARAWTAWGARRWFTTLRRGLMPLTLGLLLASAGLLAKATGVSPSAWTILVITTALSLATRLPPIVLLGAAGGLGALGLV